MAAQALACMDITTEVFALLEDERFRSTLASAARVNRALSRPALAALWRNQDSILRLFRVVPTFCHDETSDVYIFNADPTKDEWKRFISYACLVQRLDGTSVRRIHSSAWHAVTEYVGHNLLFPNLQRLDRLYVHDDLPMESIHHLFPPSMRHIRLIPVDGMQGVLGQAVLSGLTHVHALHLVRHRLNNSDDGDDDYRILPFWTFANMRTLVVQDAVDLTPEKMRGLALLPHLRHLDMRVGSFTNEGAGTPPYPFASLDTVIMKWQATLGDMRAFVTSTSFPHLKTVHLCATRTAQDGGEYTTIHTILKKLARECAHTLRAVSFDLSTSKSDQESKRPSNLHCMFDVVVEDLLQCPGLHTLELSICIPSALGTSLRVYDRDIRRLISSWPTLSTLVLNVTRGYSDVYSTLRQFPDDAPPPTVRTLAEFAQAHSHLKRLDLPYLCIPDDMVAGDTLRLDSLPVLGHGLETLHVSAWRVLKCSSTDVDDEKTNRQATRSAQAMKEYRQPVFEFAYLLDRLFPHLQISREVRRRRFWTAKNLRAKIFAVHLIMWMLQTGRSCRRPHNTSQVDEKSPHSSPASLVDDDSLDGQSDTSQAMESPTSTPVPAPTHDATVDLDIRLTLTIEDGTPVLDRVRSILVGVVAPSLSALVFTVCLSNDHRVHCDIALRFRDVFLHLIPCSGLRVLHISLTTSDSTPEFHDDDLSGCVSEAWPLLTSFEVRLPQQRFDRLPHLSSYPPTVRTLAAFARAHPELDNLSWPYVCIPPDMIAEDRYSHRDKSPILNHPLRWLHFNTWGIYKPLSSADVTEDGGPSYAYGHPVVDFAFIIFRLFPRLNDSDPAYYSSLTCEWVHEDYVDTWSAVVMLLSMLRAGEEGGHRQVAS